MNGMTNLDMEGIVIRYVGLAGSPRNTQSGSSHSSCTPDSLDYWVALGRKFPQAYWHCFT